MTGLRLSVVLMLLLPVLVEGCGKKTPPSVDVKTILPRVEGLKAVPRGDRVMLTGSLGAGGDGDTATFEGVKSRVYTLRYEVGKGPCEGCPLPFEKFEEVMSDVYGGGSFRCAFPLGKKRGIYFFMVRLVDRNGNVGPPSDTSKLALD